MFGITLSTVEWAFIKKPLRRYDPPKRNQDTPIERRLSASTVFLDALDLLGNPRGIGWSWSPNPFPRDSTPPPSITLLLVKTLFKLTLFDASRYIVLSVCPGIDNPKGGSIFDPSLALVPRAALAALCGICGGLCSYTTIDSVHHIATLVGRIVYRQPAFMAAHLSPTVDVHLDPGVLEFPLAPTRATQFCRVWSSSRRSPLREARRRHGCVCCISHPAPHRLVGGWERDGIRHRWRLLPSHGRRCSHGGRVYEGDWITSWRMDWLVVDAGLDDTVWHVHDRWVGPTWFICYSNSPGWIPSRESNRRRHHRPFNASGYRMTLGGLVGMKPALGVASARHHAPRPTVASYTTYCNTGASALICDKNVLKRLDLAF